MQIVELKVNVEKSQLTALEAQVKALQNQTITLKVNTAGFTALDNQTLKSIRAQTALTKEQARVAAAQAKTDAAMAKSATAQARVQVAQEKTAQTATRLAIEQEKTARAVNNTSTALNKASKEAGVFQRLLGGSVGEIAAKMAAWQVMGAAVSVPIRAMKDALTTMKEVDSQLVVIQKTTNFSNQQMKEIEKQAYKTASAYGQSADTYLESVAAFARAGYKEQSADLAELAVKTQLVGDTTAEVADQFLLSVDKAYKYDGSVQKLTQVLDGADYINNNYATSLEKIAEGMGIIAPVAEQAHVGVDELMAGLGTITAVTQRSGSEAARALRALFLNIIGDTKTEIEDGATWTAGEIEGLRDVLRQFAPDVVKFAEETQTVINPMEAMAALSQAMKDGVLSEQKLMEMVSDIGGKLRTSQLLAIIENWDMYESMLSDYQKAAGTADKEIGYIIDSWESKANILKNTWTEFVSNVLDTDMIKGTLDGVTTAIEFLDSGLGHAVITVGALALAFSGLGKVLGALAASNIVNLIRALTATAMGSAAGKSALAFLTADMAPMLTVGALAADFVFMAKAIDEAYVSMEEQKAVISDLKTEYEQLTGAGSEYAQLMEKMDSDEGLTSREKARLDILEQQSANLENQIRQEEELAFKMFQRQEAGTYQLEHGEWVDTGVGTRKDEERLKNMKRLYEEGAQAVADGTMSLEDYRESLQGIIKDNYEWYDQMAEWEELGFGDQFSEADQQAKELYETLSLLLDLPFEEWDIGLAISGFDQIAEYGDKSVINWQRLKKVLENAGASAEDIAGTLAQLQNDDGVILIDVEADNAETTLDNLEKIGLAVKEADGWKVDIDGFSKLATEIGLSHDQAVELANQLQEVDGVTFVDAKGNLANFETALENAGAPIANLIDKIDGLVKALYEVNGIDPEIDITVDDQASSPIQNVIDKTKEIERKINVQISGSTGLLEGAVSRAKSLLASVAAAKVSAQLAKGTTTWSGGMALLGDELAPNGAPRPELVISKTGEAFVAGLSGPVAVNLPAGSRVYPYSETQEIFSGQDVARVSAFAGGLFSGAASAGRNAIVRAWNNRNVSVGSGGGSSSGSSASAGRSNGSSRSKSSNRSRSSSGGGSSSGSSTSASTTELENLQKQLELLQAQYEFLEASNASTDSLIAKSREIQAQLHAINEYLAANNGEEKDIVSNATEWWQELDKQRKVEEKKLSILRKEYDFLEASGGSQEALNAKSKEIQDELHRINELLRKTNGDTEDVLENATAWWEELKKIQEAKISGYEDERSLLESELSLMEHQGKSETERIAKLKDIQSNLHKQAEYMRSIKASQADINQLSIEWWEVQEKILDTQKSIIDKMHDTADADLDDARKKRDETVKTAEAEIERLKTKRDIEEDILSLQEKKNRLVEAQLDLQNALNDRTVRYYNAATGQWEWGADPDKVKSAQEGVQSANGDIQNALIGILKNESLTDDDRNRIKRLVGTETYNTAFYSEEYQRYSGYQSEIDKQQAIIDKANADYDKQESMWESLFNVLEEKVTAPLVDLLKELFDAGGVTYDQLERLKELGVINDDDLKKITGTVKSIDAATRDQVIAQMVANSIAWWKAGNADERTALANANAALGAKLGWTRNGAGEWIDENGNVAYTFDLPDGAYVSGQTQTISSDSGEIAEISSSSSGGANRYSKDINKNKKKFDSGGVLNGIGGIKATSADEIVIPPKLASFMLRPSATAQFQARMAELGYIYGSSPYVPGTISGIASNRSSNDHYGDVYQYENITLTEGQARSMTVYDLAQMSRSLSIYRNA